MLNLFYLIVLCFIPIIHSANVSVSFATFQVDTDIGICTCDLTSSKCDVSCCCDPDCRDEDRKIFACASRTNQYTNTTPVISTVQPTCFKNTSIFLSNSPYIIQKMGELVCVDYARYSGSQYYQQPSIKTLDPVDFVRSIDEDDNVTPLLTLPTNLASYQMGTPIFKSVSGTPVYFTLPVNLFKNQLCSGSQSITYMNDFTTTCNRNVDATTCSNTGALSPTVYIGPLCLFESAAQLSTGSTTVCDNTVPSAPNFVRGTSTCQNALKSLVITISYSNPTGIRGVSVTTTLDNGNSNTPFQQTFTVKFVKSGSTVPTTTRNPGYLQGADIVARIVNGQLIDGSVIPNFSILKPLSLSSPTGSCGSATDERIPIRFGENIQSTCIQRSVSTCPDLHTLFMPVESTKLYVAAYSNPDLVNATTDWLPVITCTSEAGSPESRNCQDGLLIALLSTGICYVRLDIQIAYTNIGTVMNPQAVLSAVIFHYQRISTSASTLPSTLLVTETVTFQDISNAPIVEEGRIPTPNTRLPANFFYPFSVSQATTSMTFSLLSYFLITSIILILM